MLEMANLKHAQKEKLLRHVRKLDVDHVILDLGAGSSYNVLDFFIAARRSVVVVIPEPTSIENAYHFLRAAFYRALRSVARRPEARAAIRQVIDERAKRPVRSARELIHRVKEVDPIAGKLLIERAAAFAPKLIINQAENAEHRRMGWDIAAACREHLGVSLDYLGAVDSDPHVTEALAHHQPVMQRFPLCRFSKRVCAITDRLLRDAGPMTAPSGASHRETHALASYGLPTESRAPRRPRKPAVARLVGAPASAAAETPRIERRPTPPTLDPAAPGTYLRLCREALGVSLDDMTDRTRIRGLARIEQERFEELPPEPYLSGFVLQYARALDVRDVEPLLAAFIARYREACGPGDPERASG
jgi:MinD-like ATPase involved in chromosome partitioning or flagellar assembly